MVSVNMIYCICKQEICKCQGSATWAEPMSHYVIPSHRFLPRVDGETEAGATGMSSRGRAVCSPDRAGDLAVLRYLEPEAHRHRSSDIHT